MWGPDRFAIGRRRLLSVLLYRRHSTSRASALRRSPSPTQLRPPQDRLPLLDRCLVPHPSFFSRQPTRARTRDTAHRFTADTSHDTRRHATAVSPLTIQRDQLHTRSSSTRRSPRRPRAPRRAAVRRSRGSTHGSTRPDRARYIPGSPTPLSRLLLPTATPDINLQPPWQPSLKTAVDVSERAAGHPPLILAGDPPVQYHTAQKPVTGFEPATLA